MFLSKTLLLLLLQTFKIHQSIAADVPSHPQGCPFQLQNQLPPTTSGCGQAPTECPESKYRSFDGSCNNLANPGWGIPHSRYNRLLPAKYGDGISTPPLAKSCNPLPNARAISRSIYPDVLIEDPKWTLNAMQYGQIIGHDLSFIEVHSVARPCCSPEGQLQDHCWPIEVSADDPAFSQQNITCIEFVRTVTDRDRQCAEGNKSADQITRATHYLDLSLVYGVSDQVNRQLRTFQGGRLSSEQRNNQEWLPRNLNTTGNCTVVDPSEPCYLAGDNRVNQNPQLTILQTLLVREHNRIADSFAELNPLWDDNKIFQEARKINIGQHQHISYYELLPIFVGLENAVKNKLIWSTDSWVDDYNNTVNPTILNEHTTGAYRFFHSLIAGHLELVNEDRTSSENVRLSDWFERPAVLEQSNNSFNELTRGLATQAQLGADVYHDKEITLNWKRQPGQPLGLDLKAICIQRGRDHGLASYNDYRQLCGLPKATTFQDFLDVISQDNVNRLAALYEDPDDVDLAVGGSVETIVPGTLAGPTFLCIFIEQFKRTRVGDRFWFENSGDGGFTLPQLAEIRKSSIARIMCDNDSSIKSMQPRAFEQISATNVVVPCETLPSVNLTLWKDA